MTPFEAFLSGLALGGAFVWLLWRTIFLPKAVSEMHDLGLIEFNEEVIKAYRSDPWA